VLKSYQNNSKFGSNIHHQDSNPVSEVSHVYPIAVLTNSDFKTKKFSKDADGKLVKLSFNPTKYEYVHSQMHVQGLHSLSSLLVELSTDSNAVVIRGELLPEHHGKPVVRAISDTKKNKTVYFRPYEQGLPWVCIDIDSVQCPDHINFLTDPVAAVEYVISKLPSYFHGVSYHYQLSSSAGMDGGKIIKVHIWFWLDKPVHDAAMKSWAKKVNSEAQSTLGVKLIDDSLFQCVHLHYVASPLFEGLADPFPDNRCGLVKKAVDEVPFPDLPTPPSGSKHKDEKHNSAFQPALGYTFTGKGGSYAAFENALFSIGDHPNGLGFHFRIFASITAFLRVEGTIKFNKALLIKKLQHRILTTNSDHHTNEYVQQHATLAHLESEIESARILVEQDYIEKKTNSLKYGKIDGIESHYKPSELLDAVSAGKQISQLTKKFIFDAKSMGLKGAAGVGKTSKIVSRVVEGMEHGFRFEIYVPNHKLAGEVYQSLVEANTTKKLIQVIRGRDYIDPNNSFGIEMCDNIDVVRGLLSKNRTIWSTVCAKTVPLSTEEVKMEQIKVDAGIKDIAQTKKEEKCYYYDSCEYIKQFKGDWGVRIFPHSYLCQERGRLDSEHPDYVIIDESFYSSLLVGTGKDDKEIDIADIKNSGWGSAFIEAFITVKIGDPLLKHLRTCLPDSLNDELENAEQVTDSKDAKVPSMVGVETHKQLNLLEGIPVKSRLDKFLMVLRAELKTGRDQSHGIVATKSGFKVLYRESIKRFSSATPILAIDADLTPIVHKQFFADFDFYEVNVIRKAIVHQCYETRNSKASLKTAKGWEGRIDDIQSMINMIAATEKRLLVIGPQDITGNPTADEPIPAKVKVPHGALNHFGNIRVLDTYKDFDAVLIISRNQPPIKGLEAVARALYFDSHAPLNLDVEDLEIETRGYLHTNGLKVGIPTQVHPDPRVQALLELIREAETLQAVDRIRLVHAELPKHVYILSNVPLSIPVDHLLTWEQIISGATKLSEAWYRAEGVLPLGKAWLAENVPDQFPTEGIAKSYLEHCNDGKPALINQLVIGNVNVQLYEYVLDKGNGQQRKALSMFKKHKTHNKLSSIHGSELKSLKEVP
jgi:hypothetical protein